MLKLTFLVTSIERYRIVWLILTKYHSFSLSLETMYGDQISLPTEACIAFPISILPWFRQHLKLPAKIALENKA